MQIDLRSRTSNNAADAVDGSPQPPPQAPAKPGEPPAKPPGAPAKPPSAPAKDGDPIYNVQPDAADDAAAGAQPPGGTIDAATILQMFTVAQTTSMNAFANALETTRTQQTDTFNLQFQQLRQASDAARQQQQHHIDQLSQAVINSTAQVQTAVAALTNQLVNPPPPPPVEGGF